VLQAVRYDILSSACIIIIIANLGILTFVAYVHTISMVTGGTLLGHEHD